MDITIELIERGHIRTDLNHIIEGYSMGTASDPDPETQMGEGPVYNLVIEHPEATILWDSGSHPEAGEGHWPDELYAAFEHYDAHEHVLADDLEAAGYSLDDIDAVVQSHLHLDHAGGYTTSRALTFRCTSTKQNSNTPITARRLILGPHTSRRTSITI